MANPSTPVELACPHCGASVMPEWNACWLCGQDIPSGTAKPRDSVAVPVVGGPRGESAAMIWIGRGTLGLVAFTVLCIAVGFAQDAGPEGALGFLLFLSPALVITATKALNRRQSASAMSTFQIATSFVKYAIFTGLALFGIGVAIIAALFVVCLATGPPSFH
jgi:hypothetical protein